MRASLIAGLMFLMVLGGCRGQRHLAQDDLGDADRLRDVQSLQDELRRVNERNRELQDRINSLERELAAALERERELRTNARGTTVEVLASDIYFESGSAELKPEGRRLLGEVAQRMRQDYPGRTFRLEGHTDHNPIGPRLRATFPDNWALSAARAASVARYLKDQHNLEPERLEIMALGEYQPIATNETAEGRAQNRRVRIAAMP